MKRLKTIAPVAGILLLVLSAASLYVAMQALSDIRPAEDYEDIGVLTFHPYDVLPIQVQNTGASSRDRRMNPTKTVYMVYYRATDGSGYKWSDEALTRDLGEDIVEAGETVRRWVLSIPEDRTYITVEPEQTAESYAEGLREKYTRIIGLSTLYILFYLIALILAKLVRRLRKNQAADTEIERAAVPRNVSAASQVSPEIEEPRRSRRPENRSGWRQKPGGIEVRKPPRIPFRIKLSLFILAAADSWKSPKQTGGRQISGKTYFTDQRIVFLASGLVGTAGVSWEIEMKDIQSVETCMTPPCFPFGIMLTMKNGEKYKLGIMKRDKYGSSSTFPEWMAER